MNKSSFLLIICFLPSLLFSLDIWINGEFHHSYGMEELQDYGVADNPLHEGTLELERIVPLFDDVYRIEAYGGRNRIVLEEPADLLTSLSLVFTSEGFYLSRGDYRFENPSRLDIWGQESKEDSLMAIFPEKDRFTRERLDAFCRFHDLAFIPIPSDNPARELTNRILQKKKLPHLVIYPESSSPALSDRIVEKRDYYFTISTLFSRRDQWQRPMDLSQILAESSHTYSWNSYDYGIFSLFENYYNSDPENRGVPLRQALVLNRSLKEMGILKISSSPEKEMTDFFMADTGDFNISGYVCYPGFLSPLYSYTCLAVPEERMDSLIARKAGDFLLSSANQNILGWKINGLYPIKSAKEYVNPADPCLMLINSYSERGIRLLFSDEMNIRMDNWQTLSRLAVNTALSIDDLIESAIMEEEGAF